MAQTEGPTWWFEQLLPWLRDGVPGGKAPPTFGELAAAARECPEIWWASEPDWLHLLLRQLESHGYVERVDSDEDRDLQRWRPVPGWSERLHGDDAIPPPPSDPGNGNEPPPREPERKRGGDNEGIGLLEVIQHPRLFVLAYPDFDEALERAFPTREE